MEVKLNYSDYNDKLQSASVQVDVDKEIKLSYVTKVINAGADSEREINKLKVEYISHATKTTIPHEMNVDEVIKYMLLLKQMAKQL